MTTITIEPTAPKTCSNCPYFQNFGEASGRGWCSIFDQVARSHHQRTNTCDQEIETLQKEVQEIAPEPAPPPTPKASEEFEIGRIHGCHDARAKLHPIYNQATCNYSSGYMEGYNSVLNPQRQPEIVKRIEWSVRYNAKWGWYEAWVGSRCCLDKGASYEEAERIAQRQLSIEETIKRQNRAVMAAYAW